MCFSSGDLQPRDGEDQLPIPEQLLQQGLVSDEWGYIGYYHLSGRVSERGDGGENAMYDHPFLHQFANFSHDINEFDRITASKTPHVHSEPPS